MIWLLLACASGAWTREAALAPALARVDTDGDGALSPAEYTRVAWRAPAFGAVDTDRDGTIDVSELDVLIRDQDPTTFSNDPPAQDPHASLPAGLLPPDGARAPPLPGTERPPPPPGSPTGPSPKPGEGGADLPAAGGPSASQGGPKEPAGPKQPGGASAKPAAEKSAEHGDTWLVLMVLREEVRARDPAASVPTVAEIVAADEAGALEAPAARALLARLHAEAKRLGLGFPPSLAD